MGIFIMVITVIVILSIVPTITTSNSASVIRENNMITTPIPIPKAITNRTID